jgi:hypothetical protein
VGAEPRREAEAVGCEADGGDGEEQRAPCVMISHVMSRAPPASSDVGNSAHCLVPAVSRLTWTWHGPTARAQPFQIRMQLCKWY